MPTNNALKIFDNSAFGSVRLVDKEGEPWFVAADVCSVLEHTNPTVALASLDEDERAKESLGRQGETNIISESGLYALVLRSNKPNAKEFARWVRKEVLPSIRKYGMYALPKDYPDALRALAASEEHLGHDGHEHNDDRMHGAGGK